MGVRAIIGLIFSGCIPAEASAKGPDFSMDVPLILFAHCIECHRAGQIAASIDLTSYEAVRTRAESIKQQVLSRAMPVWSADPDKSVKFSNDPRLSQRDVDILVDWVNAGAPRGDTSSLPPLSSREQGWAHPRGIVPDVVLTLPLVRLPANGEIPYVIERVKVPLRQDTWIVAMQVRPGNAAVVHHMGITEMEIGNGMNAEQLDTFAQAAQQLGIPVGSLDSTRPAVEDAANEGAFDMLGVYTPGTSFESYPEGSAKLLKGGGDQYITFNVHYTTNGTPQEDRSQLALWLQTKPPKHQLFRAPAAVGTLIVNGRQLLTDDAGTKAEGTDFAIPPIARNEENYEIVGMTAYTRPVTLYQLQPHAHMRAKDFEYAVVYPDGREQTLLTVPRYDFHWQFAYALAVPLELPAGSKIVVTAHYDNSPRNAHMKNLGNGDLARNCGPDKQAYFRRENQSWDEMFTPLVQYSVAKNKRPLPTVEVVGCLVDRPGSSTWDLVSASRPTIAKTGSASASGIALASTTRLGGETYRLLGSAAFNPSKILEQRTAIKGVLIPLAGHSSINVTSMQKIAGSCR